MNPLPFSLRQLQYAVAVAEARSFRAAAVRCHVSQPSLSTQLALLEETLGVRLFERDRRNVHPTTAGQALVARAKRVLAEAEDLTAAAQTLHDPLAGTLRIGVIPTLSPYLLPELLPALQRRHPSLAALWVEEKTETLLAGLHAAQLDAVLMARTAGMEGLEYEVLGQDDFVLAGPLHHPALQSRKLARVEELQAERVLLLADGHCFRDQALELCTQACARESDFRATSLSTLARVVAGGAGVTLLPAIALGVENRLGDLAIRRFAAPSPHRTLVLAWRQRSALVAGLRELAATLRQAYVPLGGKPERRAQGAAAGPGRG